MKASFYSLVIITLLISSDNTAMQQHQQLPHQEQQLVQGPRATLDLLALTSYPKASQDHGISYEWAKALLRSNGQEKHERGIDILRQLAQDQNPYPPAQYELGLHNLSQGDTNSLTEAKMYLSWAAGFKFPPAQEQLGKLLLQEDNVKEGLGLLHAAVGPRECGVISKTNASIIKYYYHIPAVEALASWYFENPRQHLSGDSFYFTQLAHQLTKKPQWTHQMTALFFDQAQQYRWAMEWAIMQAQYYQQYLPVNTMATSEESQPIVSALAEGEKTSQSNVAEQDGFSKQGKSNRRATRDRGGLRKQPAAQTEEEPIFIVEEKPKLLNVQECIKELDAANNQIVPAKKAALLRRLKELVDANNGDAKGNGLLYLIATYANGNHEVKQDPDYVIELLHKAQQRELVSKSDVRERLMSFVDHLNDSQVYYQFGKLLDDQSQITNTGNLRHKAIACLINVSSEDDFYTDAIWRLFNCYVRDKQATKAMEITDKLINAIQCDDQMPGQLMDGISKLEATFNDNAEVLYFLAEKFAEGIPGLLKKQVKKSRKLMQRAADLKHAPALMDCGKAALKNNNPAKAFEYFNQVVSTQEGIKRDVIAEMEHVAQKGNMDANIWLYKQLKDAALSQALKWLSTPIILAARKSVFNASIIGEHRENNGRQKAQLSMQKIDETIWSDLAKIAQSNGYEISQKANMTLGCLYILKADVLADTQVAEAENLDLALQYLAQVKKARVSNLMAMLECIIGFRFAAERNFDKAEHYLQSAWQKGSLHARNRLLHLLLRDCEFESPAFKRGLDLALVVMNEKPDIALLVADIIESQKLSASFDMESFSASTKQQFFKILEKAMQGGCLVAARYLQSMDSLIKYPSGETLEEELHEELARNEASALYRVGFAYYFSHEYQKAIEFLSKSHKKGNLFAQFYFGVACEKQGKIEIALDHLQTFLSKIEENPSLEAAWLKRDAEIFLETKAKEGNAAAFKFISSYYLSHCKGKEKERYVKRQRSLFSEVVVKRLFNPNENHETELIEYISVLKEMAQIDSEFAWHLPAVLLKMHLKKMRIPGCNDELKYFKTIRDYFAQAESRAPQFREWPDMQTALAVCLSELGLCYEKNKQYKEAIQAYRETLKIMPNHSCIIRLTGIYFEGHSGKGKRAWQEGIRAFERSAQNGNRKSAEELARYFESGVIFSCGGGPLKKDPIKAQRYHALAAEGSSGIKDNIFKKIVVHLFANNVDDAFNTFKQALDSRQFDTIEGWQAFKYVSEQSQVLAKLTEALDRIQDSDKKALYSLYLGEMYYTWLELKTVAFEDPQQSIYLARKYLMNAQKSKSNTRTMVSALSMLSSLNALQLECENDEDNCVKFLSHMLLYMIKAMKNSRDKTIPYFTDASIKLAKALTKAPELSPEKQAKIKRLCDEYRRLLHEPKEIACPIQKNGSTARADSLATICVEDAAEVNNNNEDAARELLVRDLADGQPKSVFIQIAADLILHNKVDDAFQSLGQALDGNIFKKIEGRQAFKQAVDRYQVLKQLKQALDQTQDQEKKALYSLYLGEMYYSWLELNLVELEERRGMVKLVQNYLGNAQKSHSNPGAIVSASSILTILKANQLEIEPAEDIRVNLIISMLENMTRALMNIDNREATPYFFDATIKLAAALIAVVPQISPANQNKIELCSKKYYQLLGERVSLERSSNDQGSSSAAAAVAAESGKVGEKYRHALLKLWSEIGLSGESFQNSFKEGEEPIEKWFEE
jgi:Tetratricopeptide repeat